METTPQEKAKEAEAPPPQETGRKLKFRIQLPKPTTPAETVETPRPPPKVVPTPEEEETQRKLQEEEERRYREELAAQEGPASPDTISYHRTSSSTGSSTRSLGGEPSVSTRRS